MKRILTWFVSLSLSLFTSSAMAMDEASGLEMENPTLLQLVYTIEAEAIDRAPLEAIVAEMLSGTNITLGQRQDAQLFLRIEEHAGRYLLYLDFSRQMQYCVGGKRYSKDAYVWGRYAKNINDSNQLHEDVEFFLEEFIQKYQAVNKLN